MLPGVESKASVQFAMLLVRTVRISCADVIRDRIRVPGLVADVRSDMADDPTTHAVI